MRVEVRIKHLTVSGLTARSRETLKRSLASAIGEELRSSLDRGETPESLRHALHIHSVKAAAIHVKQQDPGGDMHLAQSIARRFCSSLANSQGMTRAPAVPLSRAADTPRNIKG